MADNTAQTMDLRRESSTSSVSRVRRWLVSYPRAIPLALFITICAITVLSVFAIESNARATEQAQVRGRAQFIASALERRANNFSSYLRAGAALLSTTQEVERDTFHQFVRELRLDLDDRASKGIGWAAVISAGSASQFAAQQRRQRPDFPAIRPPVSEGAAFAAPVTFFHPDTAHNRRALGFDMYSEPVREAAMAEAQRTVLPTASARIVLAQEGTGNAPGFVIFMPVLRPVPGGRSMDRALAGFIYSPFNAGEFLDAALEEEYTGPAYGVRLYDGFAETKHLLVSHSLVGGGGALVEQPVIVANRRLLLVVEAPRGGTLDLLSMVALVFGLTLASLLMLLARLLTQQAFEDQARLTFFEEQHSIRNSLTRELNHRVKNTLANVLSILALTRRRASNLDEFANSLEGRIRSLSATHDLLTGTDWGTTPLRSVIEAELQHFRAGGDYIISVDGPPVELAPNDALSFGLAIHELATNAAKYGALSVPEGRVSIYWTLIEDHIAEVEWREREGPEVIGERGRGFGTDLIEKIVAHELRHPVQLAFEREGVRCVMRVPVRRRRDFRIREDA
ncbi:MAG: CHASE domain-containing protein [Pseudomonadota bacterium]